MAKLQSNINKTISGPTEFEKKKQLYEDVKKLHEQKVPKSDNKDTSKQPTQQQSTQQKITQQKITQQNTTQQNTTQQKTTQQKTQPVINQKILTTKPTSVRNLLNDIKTSLPMDSIADSITIKGTIDTDSDSTSSKPTVSQGVKTKSRLANRVNLVNA